MKIISLKSSLPGKHQIINAALAIRAIELIRLRGYNISVPNIRKGIGTTHWLGRFQILREDGFPSVILDVGHNPAGMKAMGECFRNLFPGRRAAIIVGMVQTKDLRKSLSNLWPIANHVTVARLKTHRTVEPEEIVSLFPVRRRLLSISRSLTGSARKLLKSLTPDDIVIVCGSHYGVGEFLENRRIIYAK